MPSSIISFEQPELFEERLVALSSRFMALEPAAIDRELDRALQALVEALDIDRSTIGEISPNGAGIQVTHSYATATAPQLTRGNLEVLLPWYARMVWGGEVVAFERLPDDLPPEATAEREYCLKEGLRSQLTIPMRVGNQLIGGIGFGSFRREVHWSPRLIRSLRLISDVLANALARRVGADEELRLRTQLVHAARVNAMGVMVASIAHEVNQPLFAIVSNARAAEQLLSREEPDVAEIGAALEDIVQDANRASAVIARVRGFLQRKSPEQLALDLNEVVDSVVSLLGPELVRRKVKVSVERGASLSPVIADPVQVQQVLVNLLMNGAEAMESVKPAERRLEIRTLAEGADRVRVSVTDRGAGMDQDARRRLFEPFFTTKPAGLGMGLAICRSIVEAHGGQIRALEGATRGTTLEFWLPAHRA
ncbi:MAG: sensor histidine kinase [Myxococcaceae bacterium]